MESDKLLAHLDHICPQCEPHAILPFEAASSSGVSTGSQGLVPSVLGDLAVGTFPSSEFVGFDVVVWKLSLFYFDVEGMFFPCVAKLTLALL